MSTDLFVLESDIQKKSLEISTEGLDIHKLFGFLNGYTSKLTTLLSVKAIPANLVSNSSKSASLKISKLSRTDLDIYTVYTPEYISKDYMEYVSHLELVIKSRRNIYQDIIKPLNDWTLNMLTTPGYTNMVWLLPPYTSTAEADTKKLQDYFNGSVGDSIAQRKYYDVYRNAEGIEKVNTALDTTIDVISELLSKGLSEKATELSKNIKRLCDLNAKENKVSYLSNEQSKQVSMLVYQVAKDLELLAMSIHLLKVAAYAHDESIKKINSTLR